MVMKKIKLKERKRTPDNEPRWINPFKFSKVFGKSSATVINKIRDEQTGKRVAPFKWKDDISRPTKYLIYYDPANPPQTVLNPAGSKLDDYVKTHADINREDITKKLQELADTDQAIKNEKLKKLKIENKKNEGMYVDKEKFNRDYFEFLRSFRNKGQSLARRWRVKKDKLNPHDFELMMDNDLDKLFNELSEFKYYDSDNN